MAEETGNMEVWRCPACGRILTEIRPVPGAVLRTKCHSCNATVTVDLRQNWRAPRRSAESKQTPVGS